MIENEVSILVTGSSLVGRGLRSYDAVFRELISNSREEIMIAAFNITSGAKDVLDELESRLKCGVTIKLLVNQYTSLTNKIKKTLKRLVLEYTHFQLFDFVLKPGEGLMHAKAIVFDREIAVVGSTNLSFNGLVANHEIAVMFQGSAVMKVVEAIDRMFLSKNSKYISKEVIENHAVL